MNIALFTTCLPHVPPLFLYTFPERRKEITKEKKNGACVKASCEGYAIFTYSQLTIPGYIKPLNIKYLYKPKIFIIPDLDIWGNLEKIPRHHVFFYEETPSPAPYFFRFPLVSKEVVAWYLFEMAIHSII